MVDLIFFGNSRNLNFKKKPIVTIKYENQLNHGYYPIVRVIPNEEFPVLLGTYSVSLD